MYEPFVTVAPHRQSDGMVHFTVEFRSAGDETITRSSHTDTFTEDWFRRWCKRQADGLNQPQELTVTLGAVDLKGVTVSPDAAITARQQFDAKVTRLERLLKLAAAGVIAADHSSITTLRSDLAAAVVSRPALLN